MAGKGQGSGRAAGAARAGRLKAALKANIARRKASEETEAPPDAAGADGPGEGADGLGQEG